MRNPSISLRAPTGAIGAVLFIVGALSARCAVAAAPVSDDFNRANGALGANWTANASQSAPLQVSGNRASEPVYQEGQALYTGAAAGAAQFSELQQIGGLGVINLVVRARQYATAGAADGYEGQILDLNGVNPAWRILRVDNTGEAVLAAGALSYAAGDTFYFEAVGSVLTLKKNGLVLGTASDATYASGDTGFGLYNRGSLLVDNWRGGDVTDTQAPPVPTLTATAVNSSSIHLSWTASVDPPPNASGTAGYLVRRNGVALPSQVGTALDDVGLLANTTYSYTVSAFDLANPPNISAQSAATTATTLPAVADTTNPTAPVLLSATAAGSTQIDLLWSASTDPAPNATGIGGYEILRNGAPTPIATTGPSAGSFSNTGLAPNTVYTYAVRAFDLATPTGNRSAPSNPLTATTMPLPVDTTPPTVPTLLSATAVSSTQVNLSWTASSDPAPNATGLGGYHVFRNGGVTPIATVAAGTTTYSNGGLSAATAYTYTVSAFDLAATPNESTASSSLGATTFGSGGGSSVADSFDRANGGLGSAWTGSAMQSAPLQIVANQATEPLFQEGQAFYAGAGFGSDQFASLQYVSGHGAVNLMLRGRQYTTGGTEDGYQGQVLDLYGINPVWRIVRIDNTNETVLAAGPLSYAPLDVLSFEAVGSVLTLRRNGTPLGSASDSTYGSGDVGVGLYNRSALVIDNWRGGDFAAAADTTPPTVPQAVGALAVSSTSIQLSWNASTDPAPNATGVGGYHVFRNGNAVAVATVTNNAFLDTGLSPSSSYSYTVSAFDMAAPMANESARSPAASTSTPAGNSGTGGGSYTLGGTISGLTSPGLVLANGATVLAVAANATSFMLPGTVAAGSSYNVSVQTQPSGLSCTVGNGTGTMPSANVANVAVSCSVASAALLKRDLDGNPATIEAYYDPSLHITWLQNANYGAGSAYDNGKFNTDGRMTWLNALDWVTHLSIGGIGGWRLPTMIDTGQPGCGTPGEFSLTGGTSCGQNVITTPATPTNYSEMGHLFQVTLGNTPAFNTSGGMNPSPWLRNTGPFSGIYQGYDVVWYGAPDCNSDSRNCRDDAYWTNVAISNDPNSAWKFLFGEGEQIGDSKSIEYFAWAVHDGDVGTPVP